MENYSPKVVCFSCRFGWGYLHEDPNLSRLPGMVSVTCSGKIETRHVLSAFKRGADGVLILACPEGHCHFQDGNFKTEAKIFMLRKVLSGFGIEGDRLRMVMAVDPAGGLMSQQVEELKKDLSALGPAAAPAEAAVAQA
ncbi:MAG: hydrogenase iron-sulfur subunit [Thermodesulfobacteriota bacterium]